MTRPAPDEPAPSSASVGTSPGSARREQARREVLEDIKRSARELLVPHTTGELSLRAVARDVGIAPSGIYRYFDSRQELVAAVAADAYRSAADALAAALERTAGATYADQGLALAHAHRRWCLDHRAEFSLIFGIQPAGGDTPGPLESVQMNAFFRAPLQHFARGVRDGGIDPDRATLPPRTGSPAVADLTDLTDAPAGHELTLDVRQVAILLTGWASIHGFVSLEVYGPLSALYDDIDSAFDQHAHGVLVAMGYVDLTDNDGTATSSETAEEPENGAAARAEGR